MEFVDELPPRSRPGPKPAAYLEELRRHPGKWALIARFPNGGSVTARSRGQQVKRRNPDIEYAVRTVDDEIALYMRVVAS